MELRSVRRQIDDGRGTGGELSRLVEPEGAEILVAVLVCQRIADFGQDEMGPAVLIDGVSKAFAMTGWRIGFSYSDVDVAKKLSAMALS